MLAAKWLASVLPFVLIACGSSDPETLIREGQTALGAGNTELAQTKFNEALKELTPGEQQYIDAKVGLSVALIPTNPKKTAAELVALAEDYPRMVKEKDFVYVVSQMISAQKYDEALDLVHTGSQRFDGEAPKLMLQVERIKKLSATDPGAQSALDSNPYL